MISIMVIQLLVYNQPLAPMLVSIMLFYRGLNSILGIQSSWQRTLESIGSIESVHREYRNQKQYQEKDGKCSVKLLENCIQLKNVSFAYASNSKPVLAGINLKIPSNTSAAFVGPSGGGKSTLLDLITLIIRPDIGEVLIDGTSGSEIAKSSWRNQVGFVSQDAAIFNDSIANNICLYEEQSQDSMNNIIKAAKRACLHDFIVGLPKGYETRVGDRGMLLSGGQRQRLFIARELYRNPRVLILDEATSALDSESESQIQSSIDSLKGSVTVIIVAHRLSTIKNVDCIYVLENGKLIESGSYEALKYNLQSRFLQLIKLQEI